MESCSSEASVDFHELQDVLSQKRELFITTAVRTSNAGLPSSEKYIFFSEINKKLCEELNADYFTSNDAVYIVRQEALVINKI
jgi:hypothetical protein